MTKEEQYRRAYRQGILDGFDDLDPIWLGIDGYNYGYDRGQRARISSYELVGQSETGRERCYLVNGSEVWVGLDQDMMWRASVPGRGGGHSYTIDDAIHDIYLEISRHGRWLSEGRALHGFGSEIRFGAV